MRRRLSSNRPASRVIYGAGGSAAERANRISGAHSMNGGKAADARHRGVTAATGRSAGTVYQNLDRCRGPESSPTDVTSQGASGGLRAPLRAYPNGLLLEVMEGAPRRANFRKCCW
jgi:hypothetical protein